LGYYISYLLQTL